MVDQILAGGATSLVNLVIHALIMGALVKLVLGMAGRGTGAPEFLRYTVVIVTTGSTLFAAHSQTSCSGPIAMPRSAPRHPAPTSSNSPSATTRRLAMATCCRSIIGVCSHL
jgi:hypothetical protein